MVAYAHRGLSFLVILVYNINMTKILKWEIGGAVFISLFGSLLHFVFEWSGKFWLVGAFSAVNESTWEHLKLAVVPAVIWLLVERKILKREARNFFFAKEMGLFVMPILIIILFYSYIAILGNNLLALDISIFILAVIIGQFISYKIMQVPEFSQKYNKASIALMVILVVIFIIFTYFPPKSFLFHDPVSGGYGIVGKSKDGELNNFSSWELITQAINNCEVKRVFRAHSRDVSAELKNGIKLTAIEPDLDDIIHVAVAAEQKCGKIIMETE